jgi:hypothetical protein
VSLVPHAARCRWNYFSLASAETGASWRIEIVELSPGRPVIISHAWRRSPESQRGYRHSIDEFIAWYCSESRLSFNKTVVTRYRIHLETRQLAPGTIKVRLAAVRRLAYEAADPGLLSPELAAGRVKRGRWKLNSGSEPTSMISIRNGLLGRYTLPGGQPRHQRRHLLLARSLSGRQLKVLRPGFVLSAPFCAVALPAQPPANQPGNLPTLTRIKQGSG